MNSACFSLKSHPPLLQRLYYLRHNPLHTSHLQPHNLFPLNYQSNLLS
jgi:hypothetical protein